MGSGSRWSIDLGRLAGIRIRLHLSFFLLVLLVVAAGGARSAGMLAAELGWIGAVFACVVIHELSHSLVARRFGVTVRDILLLPIGGVSEMESMPTEPGRELAIAAAGPGASLALAAAAAAAGAVLGAKLWPPTLLAGSPLARLAWLNVLLGGFNLLPALPLDGGRVLRAALSFRLGRPRATEVAATLGRAAGIGLLVVGIGVNLWLAFIGVFVYVGATAEWKEEKARRVLRRMAVRDAMIWSPWVLDATERPSPVSAAEACRRQGGIPVVSRGAYLGLIGPTEAAGLALDRSAGDLADRSVATVGPSETLDSALDALRRSGHAAVAVVGAAGAVLGVLRTVDVVRAAQTGAASAGSGRRPSGQRPTAGPPPSKAA